MRPRTDAIAAAVCVTAALGAGVASCAGPPPALTVGPVSYTAEELGALGPSQRQTLAELTALGLVIAEGRADELVTPFVERELRSIVLQKLAMEMAVAEAGLDEAELRAAYARDPEQELVVRHLVVLSERWRPDEHRDSARARAADALARARSGEDFEALAAEYSDEPGAAERGGLLEPGREGSWVPEFWAAASSLEKGALSGVVETEFGFHVLRLEDRSPIPFEEARDRVVEDVVDLPQALGQASDWAAERARRATVDTAAVVAWREARLDPGDSLLPDPDRILVSWPADTVPPFTAADLEAYVRALSPDALTPVREGDPGALATFVEGAARNELMLARARSAGIVATDAQRVALRRSWLERVGAWATALGFREGQSQRAVKETALAAVGSPQQETMVARTEIRRVATVLEELYPVATGTAAE